MKHSTGNWRAGLGLLLLVVVAMPATAKQVDTWTAYYTLSAGQRVSVANVQGSIWVEGWDRSEVQLTVKKSASDSARLSEVEVAIEPSSEGLHVQTLYVGQPDEPVVVDYRLRVPRQVSLQGLYTVNGDIVVRNVEGSIAAHTLNGNISQRRVAGDILAQTVNGNITVALRALPDSPGALQLETINGDVRLQLPVSSNADLELSTVAGRIESNLLFTTKAVSGDTSARARLGRGGVQVRLRTVRGNIQVAENDELL